MGVREAEVRVQLGKSHSRQVVQKREFNTENQSQKCCKVWKTKTEDDEATQRLARVEATTTPRAGGTERRAGAAWTLAILQELES